MINPLKSKKLILPPKNGVGDFGSRRSFYFHPGLDLYCDNEQEIVAIEDGIVVNIECFTGPNATPSSPWWNETLQKSFLFLKKTKVMESQCCTWNYINMVQKIMLLGF